MRVLFSKARLSAFLAEFVDHSKALKSHKFTRTDIARNVFPNKHNDIAISKIRLWECYADKCPLPLDGANLAAIVAECRAQLLRQLEKTGARLPLKRLPPNSRRVSAGDFVSQAAPPLTTTFGSIVAPPMLVGSRLRHAEHH